MKEQFAVRKFLNCTLLEIQARNPQYSLRSFAQKLGMNSGALSLILAGKRKVSKKWTNRVADRLFLSPEERAALLKHFFEKDQAIPSDDRELRKNEDHVLSGDQFRLIGDWYHFAILSLVRTNDFKNDSGWIAERLGIAPKLATEAVSRLKRLQLLQENKQKKLVRTHERIRTQDDVLNLSLQKNQMQTLELAQKAIERIPVELRDFTTITMVTHPKKLKEAKALIRKFQDDLDALMENVDEKTEVYRCSVELFPLTINRVSEGAQRKRSLR